MLLGNDSRAALRFFSTVTRYETTATLRDADTYTDTAGLSFGISHHWIIFFIDMRRSCTLDGAVVRMVVGAVP